MPVRRGLSPRRAGLVAPLPLFLLFGVFLAAIVYLVAASLTRRSAPVFPPSPRERARSANWQRVGDTLTIDATDGDRWQYVSLSRGQVLDVPDTEGWEIAVQRYRVITPARAAIANVGHMPFDAVRVGDRTVFTTSTAGAQPSNAAIEHWYHYNLFTHLLEPDGDLFVVRTSDGALWKLAVVSYYCPRLTAGCLTVRYAPIRPAGAAGPS
jgi:hypothetical protein